MSSTRPSRRRLRPILARLTEHCWLEHRRSGSYILGDYQGLAATRSHIIAAFTMPVRSHAFRQEVEIAPYATR